jgi:hypothetical protein
MWIFDSSLTSEAKCLCWSKFSLHSDPREANLLFHSSVEVSLTKRLALVRLQMPAARASLPSSAISVVSEAT